MPTLLSARQVDIALVIAAAYLVVLAFLGATAWFTGSLAETRVYYPAGSGLAAAPTDAAANTSDANGGGARTPAVQLGPTSAATWDVEMSGVVRRRNNGRDGDDDLHGHGCFSAGFAGRLIGAMAGFGFVSAVLVLLLRLMYAPASKPPDPAPTLPPDASPMAPPFPFPTITPTAGTPKQAQRGAAGTPTSNRVPLTPTIVNGTPNAASSAVVSVHENGDDGAAEPAPPVKYRMGATVIRYVFPLVGLSVATVCALASLGAMIHVLSFDGCAEAIAAASTPNGTTTAAPVAVESALPTYETKSHAGGRVTIAAAAIALPGLAVAVACWAKVVHHFHVPSTQRQKPARRAGDEWSDPDQ